MGEAAIEIIEKGTEEQSSPNKVRQTTPYMTKYEKARILGTRALQIRYSQMQTFFLLINMM
jgi:DNA-directed RNA polymerase I, II, and III subunit RPABC2